MSLPARIALTLLLLAAAAAARDFRVGVARMDITPDTPVWLSGYAARTSPAPVVRQRLWAKALVVEDGKRGRIAIVTTDLIGLTRQVTDAAANDARAATGLAREQILFNSSHTHSGPNVAPRLVIHGGLSEASAREAEVYSTELRRKLTRVIQLAFADLRPAAIRAGEGSAGFAINRREPWMKANRPDLPLVTPTDHRVPVLEVLDARGRRRAVLFGYACHNTTLTAEFNEVAGDYAGFAQEAVERDNPGATALFLILCGADQNPAPRSRRELAVTHGEVLANGVRHAQSFRPLKGSVQAAMEWTQLAFASHTRSQFEQELAGNPDPFFARRARLMLAAYDARQPVLTLDYPVQAIRIGDWTLVGLGGEVVVDYGLRVQTEQAGRHVVVAGYCNDVPGYIPSARVLREGGYEGGGSMVYFSQPGPFAADVEDRVMAAVNRVLRTTRTGPTAPVPSARPSR